MCIAVGMYIIVLIPFLYFQILVLYLINSVVWLFESFSLVSLMFTLLVF